MPVPFGFARYGPVVGRSLRPTPYPRVAVLETRVSQEVIEALDTATPSVLVSQEVIESLDTGTPTVLVSQEVVEALDTATPIVYVSQLVMEILQVNLEATMLPVYPSNLPGLAFNVKWTPQFFNMPSQIASAGASIDLAYADTPLHEFELIYEFLRDNFGQTEFKTMMGFFLKLGGTVGRFLFRNPDDYIATAEYIATTDGFATLYGPVTRTFGTGDYTASESVGWVDLTAPVKIYLDGIEQGSSAAYVLQTTPGDVRIKFTAAPTIGQVITMDFNFYYYCKFMDNIASFEKFMNQIWTLPSIRIGSCRPGA
jgi:hypothetical protein